MSGFSIDLPDEFFGELVARVSEQVQVSTVWRDVAGVARAFEVDERQVRSWRERGCPARRVGRRLMFSIREVEAWLDRQERA